MGSEHIAGISLDYDENTYDWQSKCDETALRFHNCFLNQFVFD